MNELLLSNQKLMAVFAVVLIILIGLFVFLIKVDKKVTRLEKQINSD